MPACGLSVFSARMHYLIAPYLLGNHFQTREGDSGVGREGGGILLFASSRDFSSMRVCGDAENGPNVRGERGGGEGRKGDKGMREGPSNTLIKTQSHFRVIFSARLVNCVIFNVMNFRFNSRM